MAEPVRQRTSSGFLCRAHAPGNDALDLIESFEHVMLRLVWLEQKRWAQILGDHGLTVAQFLVLAAIWERQEGCHMGDLAGDMLQSSATMTGIVDRLVRMDLVRRQAVAADRRLVLIDLTEGGRAILVRVQSEKRHNVQRILERLSEADRREMIRLLSAYLEASGE
jgi:DNA-binding MarR family transcriptional regulator